MPLCPPHPHLHLHLGAGPLSTCLVSCAPNAIYRHLGSNLRSSSSLQQPEPEKVVRAIPSGCLLVSCLFTVLSTRVITATPQVPVRKDQEGPGGVSSTSQPTDSHRACINTHPLLVVEVKSRSNQVRELPSRSEGASGADDLSSVLRRLAVLADTQSTNKCATVVRSKSWYVKFKGEASELQRTFLLSIAHALFLVNTPNHLLPILFSDLHGTTHPPASVGFTPTRAADHPFPR